jgi:predicted pyridoxine 5'-phosphate oxidase superfamily flavin-nucleotide-binding protein
MTTPFYHEGSRRLQDKFDSRRIADRLEQVTLRRAFNDDDRDFIQRAPMFFLASADADGRPDCSYKGGAPGFVQVLDGATLAFPSYDGNGQFRSLGNLLVNPHVGLLFIDFQTARRLRVNGTASIDDADPLRERHREADAIVRVAVQAIFPNCPRYIHEMQFVAPSEYAPRPGHVPPVPAWKEMEVFRDHLPRTPRR